MRGGDDGSGLKERSNGCACGSEGRWSCGSISRVEDGRRRWNRCRMWEAGLVDVWKRLLRDWCSLKGRRS